PKRHGKPGPRGPDLDLIRAVVEMRQRNPRWGCPRIADQIGLAFGIAINKDVVLKDSLHTRYAVHSAILQRTMAPILAALEWQIERPLEGTINRNDRKHKTAKTIAAIARVTSTDVLILLRCAMQCPTAGSLTSSTAGFSNPAAVLITSP